MAMRKARAARVAARPVSDPSELGNPVNPSVLVVMDLVLEVLLAALPLALVSVITVIEAGTIGMFAVAVPSKTSAISLVTV